jgi:hypothetical protein
MPTQSSRPGSGRTRKPAAPAAGQSAAERPAAEASTEVTAANLERRDIPSFSESREARIAEAAYWRAERRGFVAGQELDDWLAAEREVDEEIENRRER